MDSSPLHLRSAREIPLELGNDHVYESAWRFLVRKPFGEVEHYVTREGEHCSACRAANEFVVLHADGSGLAKPMTREALAAYTAFPENPTVFRDATRVLGVLVARGYHGIVELQDGSSEAFAEGDLLVCGVRDELSVLKRELIDPESSHCAYRRIG